MRIRRACLVLLALTLGCGAAPTPEKHAGWWEREMVIEDWKRKVPAGAPLVGTEHPFTLEEVSPNYVIVCQAREDTNKDGRTSVEMGMHGDKWGDELVPYLVRGDGPGERLDVLVDTDPKGRYVAAIQKGKLWIIDTETDARTDLSALGASIADDGDPLRGHRAAAFDSAGRRVVYLRSKGAKEVAVVREIATGAEVEIDAGEGRLWRASFDGEWVYLRVIARDTDGNGRLEFPSPATSLSGRACRAPIVSYSVRGRAKGDDAEERIASVDGGAAKPYDDAVVTFVGTSALRREADGAIVMVAKDGTRSEMSPASCGARVLGVDEGRGTLVVACHKAAGSAAGKVEPGGKAESAGNAESAGKKESGERESPVELHSAGKQVPLGITFRTKEKVSDSAVTLRPSTRLLLWSREIVIDLEKQTTMKLAEGERAIHSDGNRLLTAQGKEAVWRDVETGEERRFPVPAESKIPAMRTGPMVLWRGLVLDMDAGKLLGRTEGTPLALGRDGRLLYDPGQRRTDHHLPHGPLWWAAPLPP